METLFMVGGALVAAALAWWAVGRQNLLYSEPAFRENPARGAGLLRLRIPATAVAAVAVAIAVRPDHYDAFPGILTAAFIVGLVVLASTDIERRRLPNRLTYPMMLAAIAFCWAWPDRSVGDIAIGAGIAAGIGVALFAFGLLLGGAVGGGSAFGLGDAKLILLIGLLLGWPAGMSALLFGVVAAGVPALALTLTGKGRHAFSYGPFLVLGALIVLLWPDRFV